MLGATGFPVQKRYVVDGQAFYYRNAQHPGAPIKDVVQVFYQFKNEEKAGLGMPMPAGTVRVYQADSKGGVQFVGEDRIDHTPKDEATQSQDRQRVRRRVRAQADGFPEDRAATSTTSSTRSRCATTRRRRSTVEVNEPIGGTWRMLRVVARVEKTSAWAAQFKVPVSQDGVSDAERIASASPTERIPNPGSRIPVRRPPSPATGQGSRPCYKSPQR